MQLSYFKTQTIILFSPAHSAMYTTAGEHMKAIEIMGENGWVDK